MDARRAGIKHAQRTNAQLRKLFDALGTAEHPRGSVLSAYRVARAAVREALRTNDVRTAREALLALRATVGTATHASLRESFALGARQAQDDLAAYELAGTSEMLSPADAQEIALLDNAQRTVLADLDAQLTAVLTPILAGFADADRLLGDANRVGVLSPAGILNSATYWLTTLALAAYAMRVEVAAQKTKTVFKRQAIAALDERTTDCCLRVHGQVVGLNDDFKLTGTPRYADHLRNPPFHFYCRTATALVRAAEADDDLTAEMIDAARAELNARAATGKRVEIHPAHATSRR